VRIVLSILTLAGLSAASGLAAADAKAGAAVYDKSCKSCHGADGTANPAIVKMMKVDIKDLKSADVQATSDADLKKTITDGKGKMKGVKTVSPAEADEVVAYLHTLKK
jgi:predicted CXXCH cytochrome family protein